MFYRLSLLGVGVLYSELVAYGILDEPLAVISQIGGGVFAYTNHNHPLR